MSTLTAPSARAGAAIVYDAAAGGTILFGGCPSWGGLFWSHDCTALGDTWLLTNGNWTNLTSNLTVSPPARADAGIAYDSASGTVVLFGGFDGWMLCNDTWAFANGTWTQMFPALSPSARFAPGMTYDAALNEVVLFGGADQTGANSFGDTWTYQAGNWAQVSTTVAPAPRFSMTMSYNPNDQDVLLFSGWSTSQTGSFGDTWTFWNGSWSNLSTTVGPSARNYAAMAFDPALNASILTGGHVGADAYNDTWAENVVSGWTEIPTTSAPPPRWGLGLAYDTASGTLWMFGGVSGGETFPVFFNDLWEFGPTSPTNTTTANASFQWVQETGTIAPSPRAGAAMVYDPAAGYTVLFGGCPSSGGLYWSHACTALGDTWILDNGTWTNLTPTLNLSPPARADAGIAYDNASQSVVLFGGFDGTALYGDTWAFSGGAWTQLHPAVSPSPRFSPGMVGDPAAQAVLLFGGCQDNASTSLADTWTFNGGTWTQVSTPVAPAPRFSMTMSYDPIDQYVLLFSGWSSSQPWSFGDTWTFWDGAWSNITTAMSPSPRNYGAMAFDPALNASFMTGGHVGATAYNDTWAENAVFGWKEIPTAATPPARWGLEMVYDGSSHTLWMFGGVNANQVFYNDLWKLVPV